MEQDRPRSSAEAEDCIAGSESRSVRGRLPTVFRSGPYRFFFYTGDGDEPPHVHVERDDGEAKFWFSLVRLARSHRFAAQEIRRIEKLAVSEQQLLLKAWNEFFNG